MSTKDFEEERKVGLDTQFTETSDLAQVAPDKAIERRYGFLGPHLHSLFAVGVEVHSSAWIDRSCFYFSQPLFYITT